MRIRRQGSFCATESSGSMRGRGRAGATRRQASRVFPLKATLSPERAREGESLAGKLSARASSSAASRSEAARNRPRGAAWSVDVGPLAIEVSQTAEQRIARQGSASAQARAETIPVFQASSPLGTWVRMRRRTRRPGA